MKKLAILITTITLLLAVVPGKVPTKANVGVDNESKNTFALLENAVEVSPGVFYLGKSMDKGKVVEGYVFVHYAKDSDHSKPVWDDTEDIYKFLLGGIKWFEPMTYEVNPDGSGLTKRQVLAALSASLDTWDTAIAETPLSFELFDDNLPTTKGGFNSGDRINRVTWDNLSEIFGANVIAVNYFWFNSTTKEMIESDVRFNTEFIWSVGEVCSGDWMDLQSIATHEFGHNGLNDLYMSKSLALTMHGISYGYCETHKRDLGKGDISGIQALYGSN